jgi:hypothetical protein
MGTGRTDERSGQPHQGRAPAAWQGRSGEGSELGLGVLELGVAGVERGPARGVGLAEIVQLLLEAVAVLLDRHHRGLGLGEVLAQHVTVDRQSEDGDEGHTHEGSGEAFHETVLPYT